MVENIVLVYLYSVFTVCFQCNAVWVDPDLRCMLKSLSSPTKSWTLCDPMDYTVHGILQARKLEWVAFRFSRGWVFSTKGSNPGLLHCRLILYQLSHQGSPRILEWVVYPFSSGSSRLRNRIRASCFAGGFFSRTIISILQIRYMRRRLRN